MRFAFAEYHDLFFLFFLCMLFLIFMSIGVSTSAGNTIHYFMSSSILWNMPNLVYGHGSYKAARLIY